MTWQSAADHLSGVLMLLEDEERYPIGSEIRSYLIAEGAFWQSLTAATTYAG